MIIKGLVAGIEDKKILNGVDIEIPKGKVIAVMGPNGSGKSTLSHVISGNPKYEVSSGSITLDGEDILTMEPDERARKGIFMSFQYPIAVPGVTVSGFLKAAMESQRGKIAFKEFLSELKEAMRLLEIPESFSNRYLNVGFSGGEKKRLEMLQMMLLKPKICILDETDSGLDIDALKIVSLAVNNMRSDDRSFLIITHYSRILGLIEPDSVAIMIDGRIVLHKGPELADELEERGYDWIKNHL
ncbi:MAG: Fe-S cluster assembly ATPase SufC [Candidatus Woesearchaeota archaeon]